MMVDAGYLAFPVALVVAVYVALASLLGGWLRQPVLVLSARYGLYTLPLLLLISAAGLVYAFVTHDFSVQYVALNSSRSMPSEYTWVAFYAGNAGSLLFISLALSVITVAAVRSMSRRLPHTTPYSTGLMALILGFFIGVMTFMANPLERLAVAPADGQGINPLLVHFGMFIHPPWQMIGLVSVAVPFSIAMGGLLAGRGGRDEWIDLGRIWGLVSWFILTIGLLLGTWWAYTILGWGGYWAWDPVENSALMPWLAMTAFLHSLRVQKSRGMFRTWNIALITVAFALAQMGTFINRGGAVPSVHSFAQSTMGWLFLFFMAFTLVGSLIAFAWRIDTLKSRARLESMLSRESAFLLQNVLFLAVAFVTLWGTIYPVIADASQGETVTIGEPYFNRVNGPLILGIILLTGVGPLLPWRRASLQSLARTLRYPFGATIVFAVILAVVGIREVLALLAFSTCALIVTGVLREWVRGTISRHRTGESFPIAFVRLLSGNRPRYGGAIVHLAIVMLAVGAVGSSFYSIQRDFTMAPGDTASLGSYSFRYVGLQESTYPDRQEVKAEFDVHDGDRHLGAMYPTKTYYQVFDIGANRAAIRSTPIEDFYIVPSEFDVDDRGVFRVYLNPLVWWMWASGPVLLLGTLFALIPRRRPVGTPVRAPFLTQPTSETEPELPARTADQG